MQSFESGQIINQPYPKLKAKAKRSANLNTRTSDIKLPWAAPSIFTLSIPSITATGIDHINENNFADGALSS